jgi:hypothetical protein
MKLIPATIALLIGAVTAYPAQALRDSVPVWDFYMVKYGYDYEMYTVTTEDKWDLTLFRITGKAGKPATASTKPPILL